jgi:hypothetical protein
MGKNMGVIDRIVRIVVAIVIAGLWYKDKISGVLAIILLILAIAFIITSFIGFCPLYKPLGLKTTCKCCEEENKDK